MKKRCTFSEAISEATRLILANNSNSFVFGIAVSSSGGIFGTTLESFEEFGSDRVIETPAMENALAGIAAGASLSGLKPIVVHSRNDFMLLSLDSIVNIYSKWNHMYNGNAEGISVVTRAIIGRGWGQGATHSQSIQSILGHFPGLRVVMPAFPVDAKGMLIAAIESNDPVIILEHRNLYQISEEIELGYLPSSLDGAKVVREGTDLTIVAVSICVQEALESAKKLNELGISVEIIDLRSIRPLDFETIKKSIRKTRRMLLLDTSWVSFGYSAEIAARVLECNETLLDQPIVRIGQSENPAPVSSILENEHFPSVRDIELAVQNMLKISEKNISSNRSFYSDFHGPY